MIFPSQLSKAEEREYPFKLSHQILKKPTNNFTPESDEFKYRSLLTQEAFKKVLNQYQRRKGIDFFNVNEIRRSAWIRCGFSTISVTPFECECNDFAEKLPCRHIFAIRAYFKMELYDEKLILERWKMSYYLRNQPIITNPKVKILLNLVLKVI